MLNRYKQKHGRKGNRWKTYDYSQPGWYFVTICTRFMVHWFGAVQSETMNHSSTGLIAHDQWLTIPLHNPNIMLDEFVVMPNHIHGIIRIVDSHVGTASVPHVGTAHVLSLPKTKRYRTKMQLSKTIHGYKGAVSKIIHQSNNQFQWQRSFHDHIIRTESELFKIRQYIRNNPKNWNKAA